MTPTPPTNNGRVLERIMRIFWEGDNPPSGKLEPAQYNRICSHILTILDEEYEEPESM